MFRHHLWVDLQAHLTELGREANTQVDLMYVPFFMFCCNVSLTTDDRADSMPRWRGLAHFEKYITVDFTDGSKWEDMSKVCRG